MRNSAEAGGLDFLAKVSMSSMKATCGIPLGLAPSVMLERSILSLVTWRALGVCARAAMGLWEDQIC